MVEAEHNPSRRRRYATVETMTERVIRQLAKKFRYFDAVVTSNLKYLSIHYKKDLPPGRTRRLRTTPRGATGCLRAAASGVGTHVLRDFDRVWWRQPQWIGQTKGLRELQTKLTEVAPTDLTVPYHHLLWIM